MHNNGICHLPVDAGTAYPPCLRGKDKITLRGFQTDGDVLVVQRKIIARSICQRLLVENREVVGINDP